MKIFISTLVVFGLCSGLFAKSKLSMVQDILSSELVVKKVENKHGDLYTAYMESGEILYVDIKNKFVFYGSLLQSKNNELVNLTRIDKDAWQTTLDKKTMTQVDLEELKKIAVLDKINGGSSKNAIVMFDSITCPYCTKTNEFFKTNGYKLNVHRIYNRAGNVDDLLEDKFNVKDEDKRLDDMEAMYRKYNINSTPNIMVIRNNKVIKLIKGANVKEIKQWVHKL